MIIYENDEDNIVTKIPSSDMPVVDVPHLLVEFWHDTQDDARSTQF